MNSTKKLAVACGLAIAFVLAVAGGRGLVAQDKTPAPADRKVVWDGDRTFPKAFGHVEPKEKNTLAPQTDEVHAGKVALELAVARAPQGESAVVTGGWNWHGWYPSDSGDDLTPYTHFVFWMKVEKGKKIDRLEVGLESSTPRQFSPRVDVAKYNPDALDGQWREVAIPAADFIIEGEKFNPKTAWELRFKCITDESQIPYSIYFDDIAYEKRAGAATQPTTSAGSATSKPK